MAGIGASLSFAHRLTRDRSRAIPSYSLAFRNSVIRPSEPSHKGQRFNRTPGQHVAVKSSDRTAETQIPNHPGADGAHHDPALAAAVSNACGLGGIRMWGLTGEEAARRVAGFRQLSPGSLNVNYPLWPEPRFTAEAGEAMRRHLQPHYDAKGLGPVPQPEGVASDVSPEHVAMLLEQKPEVVSFHFGLPDQEVVVAIKIRWHLYPVVRNDGRRSSHAGAAWR
jgi:hypothetical protein